MCKTFVDLYACSHLLVFCSKSAELSVGKAAPVFQAADSQLLSVGQPQVSMNELVGEQMNDQAKE